jgi:histidinol dehydrogenase
MQIFYWDKSTSQRLDTITNSGIDKNLTKKVSYIINHVATKGDTAIHRFTKEFDGVDIPQKKLRITEGEVNRAYEMIDVRFVSVLTPIIENVRRYYKKELKRSYRIKPRDGVLLGKKSTPLKRVGIYIPGGQAPLISTIYMTAVPAQVAGVKELVMVTPPNKETGAINPHLLVVADLLGIKEIYRVGGAQGIAALAFGTKTIKKVDNCWPR